MMRLCAAVVLAFACASASAQAGTTGTIQGRVLGSPDGEPLARAKVLLISEDGATFETISDKGGYYHFLSLYPDRYWEVVTRSGRATMVTQPFDVHADQVTECNVRLLPQLTGIFKTQRAGNRVVPCSG